MNKIAGVCALALAALGAVAPAADAAGAQATFAGSRADQRMQAYLRDLATQEETFFTDHLHYATAHALQSRGYIDDMYEKLADGQVVVVHLTQNTQEGYCFAGRVSPHHWFHYASMNGGLRGVTRSDACSLTVYPTSGGRIRPS